MKVFRNIRQKLLPGGRLSKYILYALGEIVLVVLGILIAVQINTWKNESATRKLEISTLKELSNALAQDTLILNSHTEVLTKKRDLLRRIIMHVEHKKAHTSQLDTMMMEGYYHRGYKAYNISAYELLRERGLDLISNDGLRKKIASHYTTDYDGLMGILDRLEKINLIQGEKMYDHFRVHFDIVKAYDYERLLRDPKMMGPFYHFETMNSAYIREIANFKNKTMVLLNAINDELTSLTND